MLRLGGLVGLGVGLGDVAQRRAPASDNGESQRSCILIWLDGGPSHLETFDPKPDAPLEVRGPLGVIATRIGGIVVSELMPRTAGWLHKVALVRSVTSGFGEHDLGTHAMMSGYAPTPALEYPCIGSVVGSVRPRRGVLPAHIAIPDFRVGGGKYTGQGFLAADAAPFAIEGDPARPDFQVAGLDFYPGLDGRRLARRREFLSAVDRLSARTPAAAADPIFDEAYRLITSSKTKEAFDLSKEDPRVRARYGTRTIGQCCLLARRLVERGVPFVTVNFPGWDTHADLATRLRDGYAGAKTPVGLVPLLDEALTALLEDLGGRGMLDRTLVVVMGEFGRTPKLNNVGGRDHWPRVFSLLLAGGGIAGGVVIGRSDERGESPIERAVTPADVAATIYSILGVPLQRELTTNDGRTVRVNADGKVIDELLTR